MFEDHYTDWRESRIRGIRKYVKSEFLTGATLLEVGCAIAHTGRIMKDQFGCIVDVCDGRPEHVEIIKERHPDLNPFILDCEKQVVPKTYDVILHWGLLYHINPNAVIDHMRDVCTKCDILLLETEVKDSNNPEIDSREENGGDQALHYIGSRPTASYVEQILNDNNFKFKIILDPEINSGGHVYDWVSNNSGEIKNGLRRYWICWKNECPLKE